MNLIWSTNHRHYVELQIDDSINYFDENLCKKEKERERERNYILKLYIKKFLRMYKTLMIQSSDIFINDLMHESINLDKVMCIESYLNMSFSKIIWKFRLMTLNKSNDLLFSFINLVSFNSLFYQFKIAVICSKSMLLQYICIFVYSWIVNYLSERNCFEKKTTWLWNNISNTVSIKNSVWLMT